MEIKLIDNMRVDGCNECGVHGDFMVEIGGDHFPKEALILCPRHAAKLARHLARFFEQGKAVPSKRQHERLFKVPKRIERQAKANEAAHA